MKNLDNISGYIFGRGIFKPKHGKLLFLRPDKVKQLENYILRMLKDPEVIQKVEWPDAERSKYQTSD